MLRLAKMFLALVLILIFVFMFVFTVFFERTTESDYSTLKPLPEFSLEELKSGKYTSGIVGYFTDTVPGRDRFVDINSKLKGLYGIFEDEIVVGPDIPDDSLEQPDWEPEESTPPETSDEDSRDETSDPDTEQSEDIDGIEPDKDPPVELSGSIVIIGTRGMEIFYGNLKNGVVFAETLNYFADNVDPGVNVYSMVIPKASAYYLGQSQKYSHLADRCFDNMQNIHSNLSDKVKIVDVYDILKEHAKEEIFFRTDHHWTALGGYYATKVFAKEAGVPFTDLSQYEEIRRPGYVGTLYKYSDYNQKLLNNPEDMVSYIPPSTYKATFYDHSLQNPRVKDSMFWSIPEDKKSSWYSTFLNGDKFATKVESDSCKNGRTLLLVKDSYGNVLAPYLVDSFQTIYIVDARDFRLNLFDTVLALGVTDVLFAEVAFSAVGGNYINKLKGLMG